jgi:prophage regulatory protein
MTTTNQQQQDNILRWPEVQARIPISRSHAHALAAQGKFPKPIKLGPRASGWLESEINTWLADRIAQSRHNTAVKNKNNRLCGTLE